MAVDKKGGGGWVVAAAIYWIYIYTKNNLFWKEGAAPGSADKGHTHSVLNSLSETMKTLSSHDQTSKFYEAYY